jgi:hypothetical protein
MNIDITQEEWEFILRFCVRAKSLARMNLLRNMDCLNYEKDLIAIDNLIDKLEKVTHEI